jgi:valyl-tRNA synthetase
MSTQTPLQLPKAYSPAETEPRVRERWESAVVDGSGGEGGGGGAFHADPGRVLSGERKPYCILIPPPNVTGALHLGHALNNTIQDILARAHRMMGDETLWIVGTDHAGIATQAVVERRLRKEGKLKGALKAAMTREQFVEQVQGWKDEYEARITGQLKAMGASCDYARQRFTMDPICARAVREAFFRLFKDGLIYRGKRLVNWDPALQTAVADDECEDIEVDAAFYYLRYPLVHAEKSADGRALKDPDPQPVTWSELVVRGYPGAEQHPGEQQAWITVATTRPETYLGDVAGGMNPRDPRFRALENLWVELPLVGRLLPIVKDEYVVLPKAMAREEEDANDPKAEFATGFLKVTPAHDQNDYDLYQRHKETIDRNSAGTGLINVMAPDATISDKHGWGDLGDGHIFVGKSREEARKLVVAEFYARGLLEETRPYRHTVKHSDRSKAAIEPYLSDQWYVRVTDPRMAPAANEALVEEQRTSRDRQGGAADQAKDASNRLRFFPARYAKTYEQWHDNIRDWCISRQLWWGHRIPVWHKRAHINAATWSHQLARGEGPAGTRGPAFGDMMMGILDDMHVVYVRSSDGKSVDPSRMIPTEPELEGEYDIYVCPRTDELAVSWRLEDAGFKQDSDVLDTWFSSALWPLSTLGWPEPDQSPETKDLLQAFNPTSLLSTAREIITLWVSRMVMFNQYFLAGAPGTGHLAPAGKATASPDARCPVPDACSRGPVPFRDVFIHAVVQDGDGKRMSKSAGNGVDPLDIIQSHGADAMRFTLCHMTTQTQDVRMPVAKDSKTGKNTSPKFDLGRNFCNKLWNASRFALGMLQNGATSTASAAPSPASPSLVDRWMLSRLHSAVRDINAALAIYDFAGYAQSLYDILWRDFCDWYLEAIKPTVAENAAQRAVLAHALETIVRLLHPVTPFVTEAIWEHLREVETAPVDGFTLAPSRISGMLCGAGWPVLDDSLRDEAAERDFERARGVITAIREVRAQHNVPPKRRISVHAPASLINALRASGGLAYVESLAGVEQLTDAAPTGGTVSAVVTYDAMELTLTNLADAVDAGAEKDRLAKDLADKTKSAETISKRLENPGYMAKAPAKLVEESKAQLETLRAEIAALRDRIASVS